MEQVAKVISQKGRIAAVHGRYGIRQVTPVCTSPNTWFLLPTRGLELNCSSIGSAVFAWLTTVTDGQTDRQTDHTTLLGL